LLFIDDLPDSIKSFARLYAGDLKLVGDANKSEILKNDLQSFLPAWISDWGMNFNPDKSAVIELFILEKITQKKTITLKTI
jgi:hypothetical protein